MEDRPSQKILVVDDEELVRKVATAFILKMGYACDEASSGEEALARLQAEDFDIVLSDLVMNGMNGMEFMKKAKEGFLQSDFIIMTGYTSEYSYADIIKAGAIDYLPKPFEQAELQARLERAIKERILLCESRRMLRKLEESSSELNQIFNTAADGMRIIDRDFNVVKINDTFSALSGISRNKSKGMKCYDVFSTPLCHSSDCPLVRILNGEQRIEREIEKKHKDGDITFYSVTAFPFRGSDGELVGIIEDIRDITESRQILGQLLHSEKMASIGQLAAGIAHEINNPTGFVSSNLKTLSDYHNDISSLIEQYRRLVTDLKETVGTAEYPVAISEQLERIADLEAEVDIDFVLNDISDLVKESREGTERIKKIVIDLKDFAHPGEDKPQFADINRNMESTLNVVWNELKYKAKVIKEYGDLPQVKCYTQQLNQVFMNLLVNAAQAIEKEGEIRIVTRSFDGYVEIKISDTGIGISEENLSKIFDPFFTTKEVGKGTGLGLNVAYNIIKKHSGTIDVESTAGKGTTFTIRIPVQIEV